MTEQFINTIMSKETNVHFRNCAFKFILIKHHNKQYVYSQGIHNTQIEAIKCAFLFVTQELQTRGFLHCEKPLLPNAELLQKEQIIKWWKQLP